MKRFVPDAQAKRPKLRSDPLPPSFQPHSSQPRSEKLKSRSVFLRGQDQAIKPIARRVVNDRHPYASSKRRPVPGSQTPIARRALGNAVARGTQAPGLPRLGQLYAHNPGLIDTIGTRVFASKGRDSYLQRSRHHYRARFGLSFCFGGSSFYTGFWNYCHRSCYAPYWWDCYQLRWGKSFYWWLPAGCYPTWRRYWSNWWCWSTSYDCQPWELSGYWGTPMGFYAFSSSVDPDSSSTIYTEHMDDDDSEPVSVDLPEESSVTRLARQYLELGELYFRTRRYLRAVSAYEKAVELAPDDPILHLLLSDALFADGRYARAAFEIRQAFDLDPNLAKASIDKRLLYGFPEDFSKQLGRLEDFVAKTPFDTNARLVLIVNLLFSDQLDRAEKQIEVLAGHLKGNEIVPLLTEAIEEALLRRSAK